MNRRITAMRMFDVYNSTAESGNTCPEFQQKLLFRLQLREARVSEKYMSIFQNIIYNWNRTP